MEIDLKSVGTLLLTQMSLFKCTHAQITEKSYMMASFILCEMKYK